MSCSTTNCKKCGSLIQWLQKVDGMLRTDLPYLKEAKCPKCGHIEKH